MKLLGSAFTNGSLQTTPTRPFRPRLGAGRQLQLFGVQSVATVQYATEPGLTPPVRGRLHYRPRAYAVRLECGTNP